MSSSWLLLAALAGGCGRVGFEARARASDAAADTPIDTAIDGPPPATIAFVKTFVQRAMGGTGLTTDTFTATPTNAGDAIPLHVFCESSSQPTNVAVAGPASWSITQLQPITGLASGTFYAAQYGLVAPDTLPATFTVTWTSTSMCTFLDEMGDELTNTAAAPFDASAAMAGNGDCLVGLTTTHDHDAVWAACTTNCVMSVGAGYTKTADDGSCDWAEYKVTTDPAGTVEMPSFASTTQTAYSMTAVVLAPR